MRATHKHFVTIEHKSKKGLFHKIELFGFEKEQIPAYVTEYMSDWNLRKIGRKVPCK